LCFSLQRDLRRLYAFFLILLVEILFYLYFAMLHLSLSLVLIAAINIYFLICVYSLCMSYLSDDNATFIGSDFENVQYEEV
jgi:hypothetical protein